MNETTILFPNLGIELIHVGRYFKIGSFEIAYYGIIIAIGMYLGLNLILHLAKKSGQSEDTYLTLCLITLVAAVAGTRLYYVAFTWDYYKDHLLEIFNLRQGGLAIYGGILAGALTVFLYTWKKKLNPFLFADTIVPGLVLGQAIGRWGNFFNREAFGRYTDSLFAMALPKTAVYAEDLTSEILNQMQRIEGVDFIQVHPTFLYESVWNLGLFTTLLLIYPKRKFDGQVFALYLGGYGIGRALIESLRTDQLLIPGTVIPVSILVSLLGIVVSITLYERNKRKRKN